MGAPDKYLVLAAIAVTGTVCIKLIFRWKKLVKTSRKCLKAVAEIRKAYMTDIGRATLEAQENTKQEISRDIHDNISLDLTLSKLHLHNASMQANTEASNSIQLSIELIERVIHQLSDMSKGLNVDIVTCHGLINAIAFEVDHLRATRLYNVNYEVYGNPQRLAPTKEIALFRIVQECLNNTIKHSQAATIRILLNFKEEHVDITITDDGKGFDKQNKPSRGAGLHNISDRARLIGGYCDITSASGMGTKIRLVVELDHTSPKPQI